MIYKKLQVSQKNFVRFCFQLEKKTQIGVAEFKEINWLNINDMFSQCALSSNYNFLTVKAQNIFNEFFFPPEPAESFQSLKQSLRKLSKGLNSASYTGPSLWNKLPLEIKRS